MLSHHVIHLLGEGRTLLFVTSHAQDCILSQVVTVKFVQYPHVEWSRDVPVFDVAVFVKKYEAAMEDDFNTADAVSAIFELVKLANSTADSSSTGKYVSSLRETIGQLCDVLGIITERKAEILDSEIEAMIEERQQARKAKNFALADEIRGRLLDMGIALEDTREGVKWKRV